MRISLDIKKTHLIQSIIQILIYFYWGYYYWGIREYAPYIVAQCVFGLLLSICYEAYKKKKLVFSLSFLPIVLSINFFINFKEDYFYLQLILVAFAIFSKSLFRFKKNSNEHIFNPSAIALSIAAVLLMVFDKSDLIYGGEFILSFSLAPHIYLVIFTLGCITLWYAQTFVVSIFATLSLVFAFYFSKYMWGLPYTFSLLHENIFLGITLLITDPSTSPKNKTGQAIYGSLYGISIIIGFTLLSFLGHTPVYNKVLFVPLLNCIRHYLDRINIPELNLDGLALKKVIFVLYIILFLIILKPLKNNFNHKKLVKFRDRQHAQPFVSQRLKNELAEFYAKRCIAAPVLPSCKLETSSFSFMIKDKKIEK